jgi:hypothetical protein
METSDWRDGDTFNYPRDAARLNKQHADVWEIIRTGKWVTLSEIADQTGHPEASISARLRDFRKERFGGFVVERRHIANGLWEYRLKAGEQIEAGPVPGPLVNAESLC